MRKQLPQLSDIKIPDSVEIECNLLAALIQGPEYFQDVARLINETFFFGKENQQIWSVITDMYNNHEAINMISVSAKVNREYFLNNILMVNGGAGLSTIMSYAQALVDTFIKRETYFTCVKALTMLNEGVEGVEIKSHIDSLSDTIARGIKDNSYKSIEDYANILAEQIQDGNKAKIRTHIPSVDNYTYGGFDGGDLVVLAARPSVGKTTIAMQMAMDAAKDGKKVMFFSLEMTGERLARRQILGTGLVSPYDIATGNIDWARYEQASRMVTTPNLYINDKSRSAEEICTKITLASQEGRCDFALIDYLGLMTYQASKNMTTAQAIGQITHKLKGVAKENKIPIVLLCQLNRNGDAQSPDLTNLRDSGDVEQDADIVIMLEKHKDSENHIIDDNIIQLWVRKNRDGKRNFDEPILLKGNDTYSNFQEI